jgi:hypothetical protein
MTKRKLQEQRIEEVSTTTKSKKKSDRKGIEFIKNDDVVTTTIKTEDDGTSRTDNADVVETSSKKSKHDNPSILLLQSQQRLQRKKPKTIKIETDVVEEVIPVVATVNDETGVTESTTNKKIKKKKLRRVDFDAEHEDELMVLDSSNNNQSVVTTSALAAIGTNILEDTRPTSLRLTENGGYLHTKQSRMKISQANQGKSPWNKGKERTNIAKAKISAGVRARNYEILQQKLKILNITEHEWYTKKKQIKLLRERVRKAKLAAKNYEQEQNQLKQLQQQLEINENNNDKSNNNNNDLTSNIDVADTIPSSHDVQELQRHRLADNSIEESTLIDSCVTQVDVVETATTDNSTSIKNEDLPLVDQEVSPPPTTNQTPRINNNNNDPRTSDKYKNISMFHRDIEWSPSELDIDNNNETLCPNNGPGGMICCQDCMIRYTKFMTSTVQTLQRHATMKIGKEVEELYNDVTDMKQQLIQSMKVTRRKPIPIRQQTITGISKKTTKVPSSFTKSSTTKSKQTLVEIVKNDVVNNNHKIESKSQLITTTLHTENNHDNNNNNNNNDQMVDSMIYEPLLNLPDNILTEEV